MRKCRDKHAVLERARSVSDFQYLTELKAVINNKIVFPPFTMKRTYKGFIVLLEEISKDTNVQCSSLLSTIRNVKRSMKLLRGENNKVRISYLSLAENYVAYLIDRQIIKQRITFLKGEFIYGEMETVLRER